MATWAEIKTIATYMAPSAFGGLVNSTTGAVTELAYYARMANAKIAMVPHKFSWAIRTYTLTLTGATDYDLATLIPGLQRIYQITGENAPNGEIPYRNQAQFNIERSGINMTIVGNTLKFHNPPSSGTLEIPYYTKYFVKTAAGVYQQDFTLDTDVSLVPDDLIPMLIEGMNEYIDRKARDKQFLQPVIMWDGRIVTMPPFQAMLHNAVLGDANVARAIYDFRFNF